MRIKQIQGRRSGTNLTVSLDPKTVEATNQVKHLIGGDLGVYPSKAVLVRRAVQFYVQYLKRIAKKPETGRLRALHNEHLELLKAARVME